MKPRLRLRTRRASRRQGQRSHFSAAEEEPAVASRPQAPTTVRVRNGESLYSIIVRNFGKYDKELEQEILLVNPGIKNPDLIYAEQTITLPDVPRTDER